MNEPICTYKTPRAKKCIFIILTICIAALLALQYISYLRDNSDLPDLLMDAGFLLLWVAFAAQTFKRIRLFDDHIELLGLLGKKRIPWENVVDVKCLSNYTANNIVIRYNTPNGKQRKTSMQVPLGADLTEFSKHHNEAEGPFEVSEGEKQKKLFIIGIVLLAILIIATLAGFVYAISMISKL